MRRREWKVAGPYRTGDIKLASALLTAGHLLTGFQYTPIFDGKDLGQGRRQRTKVLFEFEITDELNQTIAAFNTRSLRVNASLLLDNFHNLKSMVSNSNYLNFEEINHVVEIDADTAEHGVQ